MLWKDAIFTIIGTFTIVFYNVKCESADQETTIYRNLLKSKHTEQISLIKSLAGYPDFSKKYQLVEMALKSIFQIFTDSKKSLEDSGYYPGMDWVEAPEESKSAIIAVVENTLLFGEIVLRLPDITQKLIRANRDWMSIIRWNIAVCTETNLLEGKLAELINLASQELDIVPKDPNYVNPYKSENQFHGTPKDTPISSESKTKKKVKKEKRKGPQMSRTEL